MLFKILKGPKIFLVLILLHSIAGCKTSPNADKQFVNSREDKIYKLRLNAPNGSSYKYDIRNETEMKLEVDDKKVDNINRTTVEVRYLINKDSLGDYNVQINYDKIHLYTKNGDAETDADATKASYSINAVEKMLGILKDAAMVATVSPSGEVKSVKGYKELGAKLLSGVTGADANSKSMAQAQWDKIIGEGVIKKNMKDLFSYFPDSAVHIGDKWKINSKQKGEIPFDIVTSYRLREVNDGIASLNVDADMTSEPGSINYQGMDVTADLKGEQEGEYQMDIKTGMLKSCEINSKVKGNMQVMGRDIPITIITKIKMSNVK
jgi:Family of unknown function (DUF6263)